MEKDGFVDVSKYTSRSTTKMNPLVHNKGSGSPASSIHGRKQSKDLAESDKSRFASKDKAHPSSSTKLPTKVDLDFSNMVGESSKKSPKNHELSSAKRTINEKETVPPEVSSKVLMKLTTTPSENYEMIKCDVNYTEYLLRMFGTSRESSSDIPVKDPHYMQVIKYKLEAFTPAVQQKYAKDLSLYSSCFLPFNLKL